MVRTFFSEKEVEGNMVVVKDSWFSLESLPFFLPKRTFFNPSNTGPEILRATVTHWPVSNPFSFSRFFATSVHLFSQLAYPSILKVKTASSSTNWYFYTRLHGITSQKTVVL
jgi:hypothetical protein